MFGPFLLCYCFFLVYNILICCYSAIFVYYLYLKYSLVVFLSYTTEFSRHLLVVFRIRNRAKADYWRPYFWRAIDSEVQIRDVWSPDAFAGL